MTSKLREQAAIGQRYKEHLEDFTGALDAIEAEYAKALLDCFDSEGRDNLWRAVRVCRKMKEHFGQLASTGTLAAHQLAEISRLK